MGLLIALGVGFTHGFPPWTNVLNVVIDTFMVLSYLKARS